jgi:hypothetical protein
MKSSRKTKQRSISPADARRLAARHVIGKLFKGVSIRDGAGVAWWDVPGVRRKDVWLVYRKQRGDGDERRPEEYLMLVCKRTGRVLFDRLTFPEAVFRSARSGKSKPVPKTGNRWLDSRWWE